MKVLHTIGDLNIKSGGVAICTYNLVKVLNQIKCPTDILTINATIDNLLEIKDEFVKLVNNDYISPYKYSKNIKTFLKDEKEYDIYHTNGFWLFCNHMTCKIARKKEKPYIITPHGMLYPQALASSYWKKAPLLKLYFDKDLQEAACIHVTCNKEMEHIRNLGIKNPIAVIANPILIPKYIDELVSIKENPRRIGFLGRLHTRKNVDLLLYAWSNLDNKIKKNSEFIIMGAGDTKYEAFLKNEVKRLNLKNVIFKGLVKGKEKYELLGNLSALFVPSDFENFGMIIPEALIMHTPVMSSFGTPWEELNTSKCGWWVNNDIHTITEIMEKVLLLSDQEYVDMGNNGRKLIEEKYNGDFIAKKMKKLYHWILNGGEKPEFVFI